MTDPGTLDKKTFKKFVALIYEKCGISLSDQKEALVQARLGKRMRKLGIGTFREYYDYVSKDKTENELVSLLDAISTNVTHFFRESQHFDLLRDVMEKWEAEGQDRFRIWCAASSTGEEPYTIAMTLRETLQHVRDTKILATDISTKVLDKAKAGTYEERQVANIPRSYLTKYFTRQVLPNKEKSYQVKPDLRNMITFGRINLAHPPFPLKGPLDVIFCRNVMIYFDSTVRQRLVAQFHKLLKPGGYLLVGHAESLSNTNVNFTCVKPATYRK